MTEHDWGRSFAVLREAAGDDWLRYVEHEFVNKLADASLPEAAFRHYLLQDYVFLKHFSRAWALVVVKSEHVADMRMAAATVHALLDEEMALHIKTCAGWGLSESDLESTQEASENLAYTRFVLDTGLSGDLLDLLVALAPCVFGYGEIGKRLLAQREQSAHDNRYHDWIATYGGSEYQTVCNQVGKLLDTVAARRVGALTPANPRWGSLRETFVVACRLEADFWSMGLAAS